MQQRDLGDTATSREQDRVHRESHQGKMAKTKLLNYLKKGGGILSPPFFCVPLQAMLLYNSLVIVTHKHFALPARDGWAGFFVSSADLLPDLYGLFELDHRVDY